MGWTEGEGELEEGRAEEGMGWTEGEGKTRGLRGGGEGGRVSQVRDGGGETRGGDGIVRYGPM